MSWIDILQTLGIIASFLLAFIQMWIYVKSLRASSHVALLTRLDNLNRLLFENSKVFADLYLPYDPQNIPEADPRTHLLDMIFTLFEEVYFQHYKYKFISKQVMDAWARTIKSTLTLPYAIGYWTEVKDEYPEDFRKFVDMLIGLTNNT